MTETQRERQLHREQQQLQNGIQRYRKQRQQAGEGDSGPGRVLVLRAVEPVKQALDALIERVESGRGGYGRPTLAVRYLQQLEPEAVAFLTARVAIGQAARKERLTFSATLLATLIEEHYQFEELYAAEEGLAVAMERKARKWTTDFHRRAIMRRAAEVADVTGLEWSKGDKLHLGMKLFDLFIEETGLAEAYLSPEGKNNTPYRLRLTQDTADWLMRQHERCEILEPQFTPMVCPPRPWTSVVSGGYLSPENKRDFVKGVSPALRDDLLSTELTPVFEAVNAIQATPWRINRAVYDVFRECWNAGDQLAGLPSQDPEPIPTRPGDIPTNIQRQDMPDDMRSRFDSWRHEAAAAHDHNAELIGKRIAAAARLSMATDMKDEPAIYFPHNVDFRGRIYSIVPDLNPQADDLGKGLLEFAEGKPLGESGAFWLCVHIANLFGVDKVDFTTRANWTMENATQLLDSASNPLDGRRFWTEADDPWCALAACFEFMGWHVQGDDYVSHLPIAMDGSCSGLQHFSAMLRDEVGGAAVNLTPTEEPSDVYSEVQNAVEVCLNDPALSTDQLAQAWRGKVTRKIVKRPCMTFAYSVTSRGIRDQILGELRKATGAAGEYLPGFSNFEAASYLAPIVETAIKQTVDRASEAMDWLRDAVRRLLDSECPVTWLTPLGLPVQQRYMRTTGKRFRVWFSGISMKVQLRTETDRADRRRQASAVAPNFVHSLDACHLMLVVLRMLDEGLTTSFAMIHDSFGVHAGDVDELHYVIRDEFIRLYSEDRLEEFREQVLAHLPMDQHDEVPPTPKAGQLDLESVRDADFFFS